MAINKRFTQLNNSGSNHSILDAESAYITGTLQVGPAVPALGSDVNFFVSGAKDGEGGATPAVGVFGGDLVVSGNLHFLGGITGSIPGVEAYWSSPSLGVIKAETSSSMVEVPYLSASNGAEVTGSVNVIGSVLVDLTQGPNQTFIISGSYGQSSLPYLEIVDSAIPLATYSLFTVAGLGASSKGVTVNSNDPSAYVRIDPFAAAIAGADLRVVSGSNAVELYSNFTGLNPAIYFTAPSSSPTAFIVVNDNLFAPADLDLTIRALQINGDPGTAGYVLTSSGPGVAPGWAAQPAGASEYWFSSGSGAIATTGSVALVGGDYANLAYDTASDYGADIFLYVSGDIYGKTNSLQGVAVFGGDTVVSGTLFADNKLQVRDGGNLILAVDDNVGQASFYVSITGSKGMLLTGSSTFVNGTFTFEPSTNVVFQGGLTGSLQEVSAGVPYLLAGDNIFIATNSLGQVAISASINSPQWYYSNVNEIATSGSAAITSSLAVTGAAYFSPAGTGRGLLNFGGLDIGPITGSKASGSNDQEYYLGVDILSASNGAGPNAVIEHEMHVLAVGKTVNTQSNADHFFSATYLVTSKIDDSGVQSLIGSVELTREGDGTYINQWDVNVESDMKVALTGTMNNSSSNEVRWFVERTRERSKKW